MRAVHAVRDIQGSAAYVADRLGDFVEELATLIEQEEGDSGEWVEGLVKYMKEHVLPILKLLTSELCAEQPSNPKVIAFCILAEQLGVPGPVLTGLKPFLDPAMEPTIKSSTSAMSSRRSSRASIRASLMKRSDMQAREDDAAGKQADQELPVVQSVLEDTERHLFGKLNPNDMKKQINVKRLSVKHDKQASADRLWGVIRQCLENPELIRDDELKADDRKSKRTRFLLQQEDESSCGTLAEEMSTAQKVENLRLVPMLSKCSEEELEQVAQIARPMRFDKGETFVEFGQPCAALHIITSGVGRVSVPHYAGIVRQGDFIGEDSLRIHAATNEHQVSAVGGNVTTLAVSKSQFEELPIKKQMERRMKAVAGAQKQSSILARSSSHEMCDHTQHKQIFGYEKTASDREQIIMAVRNNKVLSEVMGLSDEQCEIIADNVHLVEVPAGVEVFQRGAKGTALFISKEGILSLQLEGNLGINIGPGTAFGELALLYDEPRSATIQAVAYSTLWVLPRKAFKAVSHMSAAKQLKEYAKMLSKIPALAERIDSSLFDVLAEVVEECRLVEREEICTIGEDKATLFLIYEGTCKCTQNGEVFKTGDWVGEAQLMQGIAADRTICVTSQVATVLILTYASLCIVEEATGMRQPGRELNEIEFGGLHAVAYTSIRRHAHEVKSERRGTKFLLSATRKLSLDPKKVKNLEQAIESGILQDQESGNKVGSKESSTPTQIQDGGSTGSKAVNALRNCEVVGSLGEGTFGLVLLLRDKVSRREYALKGLSKDHLKDESQEEMVQNERSVMLLCDSDFVIMLHHTFEDSKFLYLLLEPLMGGELYDVYHIHNFFGSILHARFYVGCISLGLTHLHSKRVIWRDLKLENCLLNSHGYLKLTDMGIAKLVVGKTYSVCGTADYFAPETLKQVGHNRAVDWWACGVILFIMLAGRSPFDAPEVAQIYKNIIKGMNKVQFPKSCPAEAEELIRALCMKKPEDRITMQKGGVNNLMSMPFFDGFGWSELNAIKMDPPFLPPNPDYAQISAKQLSRGMEIQWHELKEWQDPRQEPSTPRTGSMEKSSPEKK